MTETEKLRGICISHVRKRVWIIPSNAGIVQQDSRKMFNSSGEGIRKLSRRVAGRKVEFAE